MSSAPKRSYSLEDFSELMNARLQRLEGRRDARQGYSAVLAVLRQQIDAYRQQRTSGK